MNIFATSSCPRQCAIVLDDRRVIKMALESAQLLSTALHVCGPKNAGPYRVTHINHPCSLWVRESRENYLWLHTHMLFLGEEYGRRFHKTHKCMELWEVLGDGAQFIPLLPRTPFVNCSLFKDMPTHAAYVKTMRVKWENDGAAARWTRRDPPPWRF